MPLSKKRNRDRMREERATCVQPNVRSIVQPKGLIMDGNKIVGVQPGGIPSEDDNIKASVIPMYNPSIHGPGDRVMIKPPHSKKLIEMTIPEIDAEGYAIPA